MTDRFSWRAYGLLAALLAAGVASSGGATAGSRAAPTRLALAAPEATFGRMEGRRPSAPGLRVADGDCSGAAAQAAADSGGQVLSVSSRQQGGRTVCVVTVLVPGEDGSRPRKKTITVPQ